MLLFLLFRFIVYFKAKHRANEICTLETASKTLARLTGFKSKNTCLSKKRWSPDLRLAEKMSTKFSGNIMAVKDYLSNCLHFYSQSIFYNISLFMLPIITKYFISLLKLFSIFQQFLYNQDDSYFFKLYINQERIDIIKSMSRKEEERLYFYAPGIQNMQKILGKQQPINPYKSFLPNQLSQKPDKKQIADQMTGKFVYDHLLTGQQSSKTKLIIKPQKRKNYRTKMCPHGRDCKRKFTCTFAHSQYQLRKPFMKRTVPCKLYQLGQCQLGSACREYHGNIDLKKKNYPYQTEICQDFLRGKCDKGRVCINIHQMPDDQQVSEQEEENISDCPANQANQIGEDKRQQTCNKPEPVYAGQVKSLVKKQAVEVVQEKVGREEFVEDGLTFSLNFG